MLTVCAIININKELNSKINIRTVGVIDKDTFRIIIIRIGRRPVARLFKLLIVKTIVYHIV